MQSELNRLKTFHNWQIDFISSETLARNGFFYLGWSDAVQCAFCGVEIIHWIEGDDVEQEHQRFSPDCLFIKQKCSNSQTPVLTRSQGEDSETNMDVGYDCCGTMDFTMMKSMQSRNKSVSKEYNSYISRLNSFINWPNWANQAPERLASAGFYYTGSGDKTKCFQCDGTLKNWKKEDIPWEEHALYFKSCSYVKLVKGSHFIQKVISESVYLNKDSEREELLNTRNNGKENCRICYKGLQNTCFVPCGHVVACGECASSTDKCFICRTDVETILRLYYS